MIFRAFRGIWNILIGVISKKDHNRGTPRTVYKIVYNSEKSVCLIVRIIFNTQYVQLNIHFFVYIHKISAEIEICCLYFIEDNRKKHYRNSRKLSTFRNTNTTYLMREISVSVFSQQDLIYFTTGITYPLDSKFTSLSNNIFLISNCARISNES